MFLARSARGVEKVEHWGAAGGDQGQDIVGWMDGRRYAFQCKRVTSFGPAQTEEAVRKIIGQSASIQTPDEIVLVTSAELSLRARRAARAVDSSVICSFWARTELDEMVKKYEDIVLEFFDLQQGRKLCRFVLDIPAGQVDENLIFKMYLQLKKHSDDAQLTITHFWEGNSVTFEAVTSEEGKLNLQRSIEAAEIRKINGRKILSTWFETREESHERDRRSRVQIEIRQRTEKLVEQRAWELGRNSEFEGFRYLSREIHSDARQLFSYEMTPARMDEQVLRHGNFDLEREALATLKSLRDGEDFDIALNNLESTFAEARSRRDDIEETYRKLEEWFDRFSRWKEQQEELRHLLNKQQRVVSGVQEEARSLRYEYTSARPAPRGKRSDAFAFVSARVGQYIDGGRLAHADTVLTEASRHLPPSAVLGKYNGTLQRLGQQVSGLLESASSKMAEGQLREAEVYLAQLSRIQVDHPESEPTRKSILVERERAVGDLRLEIDKLVQDRRFKETRTRLASATRQLGETRDLTKLVSSTEVRMRRLERPKPSWSPYLKPLLASGLVVAAIGGLSVWEFRLGESLDELVEQGAALRAATPEVRRVIVEGNRDALEGLLAGYRNELVEIQDSIKLLNEQLESQSRNIAALNSDYQQKLIVISLLESKL